MLNYIDVKVGRRKSPFFIVDSKFILYDGVIYLLSEVGLRFTVDEREANASLFFRIASG